MEQRTDGPEVAVETNLDEVVDRDGKAFGGSYRVHARSRFRARKPEPEAPKTPELGDPWCPVTVRARLVRMADVFRQVPHTPDTKPQGHRSCMPEVIREIFKDQPGEAKRLPVGKDDMAAAMQTLDSFVTLNRLFKIVGWHIACKIGDRRLGAYIHRDRRTAALLKQQLLARLTSDWNARGWKPDQSDINEAQELIRKKIA